MKARYWFIGLFAAFAFAACGSNSGTKDGGPGGDDDGDGGTGSGDIDAYENPVDAPPFGGTCTPNASAPQCSNCMDDDTDGRIDGFDPECAGPLDRLEDSFATGIPGDNMDSTYQDCFFDGDSGGGNDGCSTHVCCLLQAANINECAMLAPESNYNKYDKNMCYQPWGNVPVPSKCTMHCGPLAPPGCDCFGCCTVCNANGCEDIILNPAVSPNCDQTNITSPGNDGVEGTADDPCKRCVKTANCGSTDCVGPDAATCNTNTPECCTPCPGQCDQNGTCNPPLPAACGGQSQCPTGFTPCDATMMNACPQGTYCTNGCCVGDIIL